MLVIKLPYSDIGYRRVVRDVGCLPCKVNSGLVSGTGMSGRRLIIECVNVCKDKFAHYRQERQRF